MACRNMFWQVHAQGTEQGTSCTARPQDLKDPAQKVSMAGSMELDACSAIPSRRLRTTSAINSRWTFAMPLAPKPTPEHPQGCTCCNCSTAASKKLDQP
mmetsp:Transcript_78877/g.139391  ORF Transcript_78877/g.139391 Transcript_78877/m.139391 type:complete len:99 (+) Transcript_78877:254-550(+)